MFWTGGPSVTASKQDVANFIGQEYADAFNSGTSGLFAVLQSLGLGSSHEVIVPSFTFIATCNSVLQAGSVPVFAEIEEETFGLYPQDVEKKITSRTKAILPVHYAGTPC